MQLREELRRAILTKLKAKSDPLDGFYATEETKEAILAVMISGRHLLLEGPPGTGKTTLAKILVSNLPSMTASRFVSRTCLRPPPTGTVSSRRVPPSPSENVLSLQAGPEEGINLTAGPHFELNAGSSRGGTAARRET